MSRITRMAAIAATLTSVGLVAFATNKLESDAASLATAKISMSQVRTNAEQHSGGKAARAEFEHTKTGWAYDVENANGSKTVDVRVDSDTGIVISAVDEKIDQNEDKDNTHDEKD